MSLRTRTYCHWPSRLRRLHVSTYLPGTFFFILFLLLLAFPLINSDFPTPVVVICLYFQCQCGAHVHGGVCMDAQADFALEFENVIREENLKRYEDGHKLYWKIGLSRIFLKKHFLLM